ncbi:MAG: phosphoenolpyruvate protein kinase [Acidobacteria bacterium]|nr:phosphoenolpyruvate protein kinase [Acidobacteriota bacterium]
MTDWLAIARERRTVLRGLKFALVVGTILITINHGDAILAGDVDATRAMKMALTALVPYLVSTFSTCGARLEMQRHIRKDAGHVE